MQNGHVESFNGRLSDECLNASWFLNLADAKRKIEIWRLENNPDRPHGSLAYRTPAEFAQVCSELHQQDGRQPTGPPVNFCRSHSGARRQGFAERRAVTGAHLSAARRCAEKHFRDGRLRRDGSGIINIQRTKKPVISKLRLVETIGAGHSCHTYERQLFRTIRFSLTKPRHILVAQPEIPGRNPKTSPCSGKPTVILLSHDLRLRESFES
jgi:hypothetical protein